MRSYGWEIEFLLIKDGQFRDWTSKLDRVAMELGAQYPKGKLYRDQTPCPEWATPPHIDYNKLFRETQEVFQYILEEVGGRIGFIGGASKILSTFSGHIHVGSPRGLSSKEISNMLKVLHGSQTLMELLSQNASAISSNMADRRATRTYYEYYRLRAGNYPEERQYWNYTWNEHRTVENRIPPSSDFYHLLYLTAVETAWLNHFKDQPTYDLQRNFSEAVSNGVNGTYVILHGAKAIFVDYATYVNFQLMRIEDELKEEFSKMDLSIRKRVKKYHEFLKRTTLATYLSSISLKELTDLSKRLIEKGKSYIEDLRIEDLEPPQGKFTEKNIAKIVKIINDSNELKKYERFTRFLEAMRTGDISKADKEDVPILKHVIAKKRLEEFI